MNDEREIDFERLAQQIADAQFRRLPKLAERYGASGKIRCVEDNHFHLSFLREAATFGDPSIFVHYVDWAKTMLSSRGVEPDDLKVNLEVMRDVIAGSDLDLADESVAILQKVIRDFPRLGHDPESPLKNALPVASDYLRLLLEGKQRDATGLIVDSADTGTDIRDLYLKVFEPVQQEVGRLWQLNRISVAQEHFCTSVTQRAMAQLYPRYFEGGTGRRTLLATCAGNELHEIGLRMVTDLLELEGWDTHYLGGNMPISHIISTIDENPPDMLAISVTIAGNLESAAGLIDQLRNHGRNIDVPILIGGYPFRLNRALTQLIGADASAESAAEAVNVANRLTDA